MKPQPKKNQFTVDIIVNAPAPAVWEVLGDFSSVSTWAPAVTESHSINGGDRGPNAARHCEVKGFGGIDEFITEWKEGRGLAYEVKPFGPMAGIEAKWVIVPMGGERSRVGFALKWGMRFGPIGALMNAMMVKRNMAKTARQTIEALKKRVETGVEIRPRSAAVKAA